MAKMKHTVKTWEHARDLFKREARTPKHGGDSRVNLGYATWLHERWPNGRWGEPSFAVKFHANDAVTFHPDGTLTLSTGGWITPSTRERIRAFTPAIISVKTSNVPVRTSRQPEFFVTAIISGQSVTYDMTEMESVTINVEGR